MKSCKYCGSQVEDDAIFCSNCGARLDEENKLVEVNGEEPKVNQVFAYVGFGTGLASFTMSFIPLLNSALGIQLGIIAIIFSILGKKAKSKAKFSRMGLIFGILGIVLSLIFTVVYAILGATYTYEATDGYYDADFNF